MRRRVWMLLLLGGLGVLALALWGQGASDRDAPEDAGRLATTEAPTHPGLQGRPTPPGSEATAQGEAHGGRGAEKGKMITIQGQVVARDDGKPVAGAMVFATQPHDVRERRSQVRKPGRAVSDEAGRFTIEGLEPGAWMVFVQGGGWVSVDLAKARSGTWNPFIHRYEEAEAEPLRLSVEAAARMMVTVSEAEGAPEAGLDLYARRDGLWAYHLRELDAFKNLSRSTTDERGIAWFEHVIPQTETEIVVRRKSLPSESRGPFVLQSGELKEVTIRLPAPRWIDVRVTDSESAEPVAGAKLQLAVTTESRRRISGRVGASFMGVLDTGATTDEGGKARVAVVPGHKCQVSAKAEGYLDSWGLGTLSDEIKDETTRLEIALTRARSISGRVVVPDGAKAADVELALRLGDRGQVGVHASEDGTFSFGDLRAETYELVAEVLVEGRIFTAKESVAAGSDDVVLELAESDREPDRLERMVVHVLGPDGKPVSSCQVVLTGLGQGCSHSYPPHGSEGGVVPLDVLAGELWLDVFDVDGGRLGSTQVGPIKLQASLEVRLQEAQKIVGRVLGPDGEGVRGVVVTAESPYPHTDIGLKEHARTFTDESGRFALRGLSGMTYVLASEPSSDYLMTRPMRVAGGTSDALIRLESSPEIVLTLLDPKGNPVSGARLRVQYADFESPEAFLRTGLGGVESDGEGIVRLRGLDPRRLVLLDVEPPGDRTDLHAIHREKWRMASGTITFESGRNLRGLVVDQTGKPVPRARVEWAAPDGGWHNRDVWCDAEGRFTLTGLPAGPVDVYARFDGLLLDEDDPETLKRISGDQSEVRLEVDRGASAMVRIEPWRGRMGLGRALLVERPDAGSRSRRLTSAEIASSGQVTFYGLRPDRPHTLWVEGLRGNRYVHVTDIVAGSEIRVVGTQEGKDIRGRLVPPERMKVDVSQVQLRDRWGVHVYCEFNGMEFVARGLPDGPWRVYAWADGPNGASLFGSDIVTPAEPAAVELRVR